ncbi:MAG: transcriptional regulator [Chloroflexota bacterium]|nr:transcriptional regulator [Chloroflexota bacterium]
MNRPFEDQIRHDFDRARHRAFLQDLVAVFARRPSNLISYHDFRRRVSPEGESYRGLQTVPLNQIVGSMDRFRDFNRAFFPRQRFTAGRWQSIDRAYYEDKQLPPIQLYKVGDVYFVKDGNHRVSVARGKGQEFIDAEVIEGFLRAPLYATMRPDELLLQAEYAEFLRRTDLDRIHPEHDIRPTALGRYDEILLQIEGHRRWLECIRHEPVAFREAVGDWYRYIYLPIVEIAREHGLSERFPNHTEADIYLWVTRHRWDLERRAGHDIGPAASAMDYAEMTTPLRAWRDRLSEVLPAIARRVRRSPPAMPPQAESIPSE